VPRVAPASRLDLAHPGSCRVRPVPARRTPSSRRSLVDVCDRRSRCRAPTDGLLHRPLGRERARPQPDPASPPGHRPCPGRSAGPGLVPRRGRRRVRPHAVRPGRGAVPAGCGEGRRWSPTLEAADGLDHRRSTARRLASSPAPDRVIGWYQVVHQTGSPRRFVPSCSTYALEALSTRGAAGSALPAPLARRHPWGGHGYDPVPCTFRPSRESRPACLT
jgi:putative component of membrane protein insertase Oxa1/YidC/SpoIIIJ protein YidD